LIWIPNFGRESIKLVERFSACFFMDYHTVLVEGGVEPLYLPSDDTSRRPHRVIYREDYRFLLNDVIPKPHKSKADFDLILASQPYRLRVPAAFKAKNVIAPLARALRPSGRLLGIHSYGRDPGMEIINKVWPDDNPFESDRHDILRALKDELGDEVDEFDFNAFSDDRSIFQYKMHTLPTEVDSSIGTSTLYAAWNDAVYVAQIEDDRLEEIPDGAGHLNATKEILRKHGGLWFNDESYVVSRTKRS